jgi:hypothetical protein
MNSAPEVWAVFMAASLAHKAEEHVLMPLPTRADTAAKLADFALLEFRKRYPMFFKHGGKGENGHGL